jgi:hypothetical protein
MGTSGRLAASKVRGYGKTNLLETPGGTMRSRTLAPAIAGLILLTGLFALSGCGDAVTMTDVSELSDEEALREFVDEHEFFDETEIYGAEPMQAGGTGSREAIDPLTFWREVTERQVVRDVVIDPDQGLAEVTVYKEIWGTLNIIDENMVEYEKPMHHEGTRYAVFERVYADSTPVGQGNQNGNLHRRGRWQLTSISGMLANSVEHLTMNIDWIRVQSATVDVTFEDPLALIAVPDEIMSFELGEEVTVTVSGPPEGSIVFLHARMHRSPLRYEDGVFVGTWTVEHRGAHCAGVQALAHDSVFDSEYPDDSLVWALPYQVAPTTGESEE